MADVRWGTPASWEDAFDAANFNALANNGGIVSTATAIDNTSPSHLYGRLSFICVTSTWAVSTGGHLAFYLLQLPHTGSTYPNSNNGTAVTDYPGAHQWRANINFRQATIAHIGVSDVFLLPPSAFIFYVVNRTGAALPSSATNMTCRLQRFSESIA